MSQLPYGADNFKILYTLTTQTTSKQMWAKNITKEKKKPLY